MSWKLQWDKDERHLERLSLAAILRGEPPVDVIVDRPKLRGSLELFAWKTWLTLSSLRGSSQSGPGSISAGDVIRLCERSAMREDLILPLVAALESRMMESLSDR